MDNGRHYSVSLKFQILSYKSSFWPNSAYFPKTRTYPVARNVRRALIDDRRTGPAPTVFSGLDTGAGQGWSSARDSFQPASLEVPLAYGFGCTPEDAVAFAAAAFAASSTTFFHLLIFRYAFTFSGEICQCSSDTDSGTWRSA